MWKTLTSLAIWGPGWGGGGGFNNHVMLGPYIKSRGIRGHRNVSKCSPHHNGDICTIRGNNLKNQFFIHEPNVKNYILGYLGVPEGVFNAISDWGSSMIRLGVSCFPVILSPYLCTCQIMKQLIRNFKV